MADRDRPLLPSPTPEQRRAAAGQFDRANQVIATGDYDYGIQLLLSCCRLDPANLIYRRALRRAQKAKYRNNLRGSPLAWLTTVPARARLKAARRAGDYLKVLNQGELVLARNPWHTDTQREMALAADALGLLDVAIWILEQARQKNSLDAGVNRALARLYERRGNFTQAITLWEAVHRAEPSDREAADKVKDLAARDTIQRGQYEETPAPAARTRTQLEHETLREGSAEEAAAAKLLSVPDPVVVPLRSRIQADPTNWENYLKLAAHYRRGGHLEQARQVLEQGLAPTGNRFELSLELAELEVEPFRRNLAVAEEKLKAQPDDEELRRIRVRLLKEINARELDLYRKRADREPGEMGHRFELGLRLLRGGQLDEAIHELQLARGDARLKGKALLYLGYCFKSRNNWQLAQRNFEEALENLPAGETGARKEVLFQLAQGSAEAGDLARAVEVGLELANLDFTYRDINRLLDEWQARLRNADVTE